MTERGVVRWGRVIATGLVAMIATVVLGAVAVLSFTSRTPYEAGHLVGTIASPAAIAGGVFSYLGQSGTKLAIRIIAFVGIVAVGGFVVVNLPQQAKLAKRELGIGYELGDADRAPFIVDGNRLRHPTLGFSIAALPPGFEPTTNPVAATVMAGAPGPAYAWGNTGAKAAFLVQIMTFDGPDKTFDAALRGVRAGFEDNARAQWGSGADEVVIKSLASDHDGVFHARWGRIDVQIVLREIFVNKMRLGVALTALCFGEPLLDDELASFQP